MTNIETKRTARVAALQIGSRREGTGATLEHLMSFEKEIIDSGADVVAMPEALLGGYPKGSQFGTALGFRLPEGRAEYRRYWEGAIDPGGPECRQLEGLARRTGATLVVGVIERSGHSLFCSTLFFDPRRGLCAKHRKLMPTAAERLIWSLGDGSTLPVVDSPAGKLGSVICWENYMPLLRTAMLAKGVTVWCASTVDDREIWQASLRHIAYEGRCFLASACQYQPSPLDQGLDIPHLPADRPLIGGGSVIISPMGDVLAGPLRDREGLVVAEIDPSAVAEARYDLDITGHYARPDVFSLEIDERERQTIRSIVADPSPVDAGG
jgi:nitrilase